jgi:FKBP-type peptidyl-prolyl cis-trans isomerase 2
MTVSEGKHVSIEYTLSLPDATKVDSNVGGKPLTYTQGGQEILAALQAGLLGLKVGDAKQVTLSADEGYGPVDPKAFMEVDTERVPEGARTAGATLQAQDRQGRTYPIRVHELKEKTIVLDFNHPLAGKTLIFDVKILDVGEPPQ